MAAPSDPGPFQPQVIDETPQQVTAARKNLEKTLGISISVWPHERALYYQRNLPTPSNQIRTLCVSASFAVYLI